MKVMPSSNNGKRVVTSNRGTNRTNSNHDLESRFQRLEGDMKTLKSEKDDEIKSLNAEIENVRTKYETVVELQKEIIQRTSSPSSSSSVGKPTGTPANVKKSMFAGQSKSSKSKKKKTKKGRAGNKVITTTTSTDGKPYKMVAMTAFIVLMVTVAMAVAARQGGMEGHSSLLRKRPGGSTSKASMDAKQVSKSESKSKATIDSQRMLERVDDLLQGGDQGTLVSQQRITQEITTPPTESGGNSNLFDYKPSTAPGLSKTSPKPSTGIGNAETNGPSSGIPVSTSDLPAATESTEISDDDFSYEYDYDDDNFDVYAHDYSKDECAPGPKGSNQRHYRGLIDRDRFGQKCERWDSVLAKKYQVKEYEWIDHLQYPNAGLENNNFCRNPSDDQEGAWCIVKFLNSVIYESCNIPDCPRPAPASCATPDKTMCACDENQADYRGDINVTDYDLECESWDADWLVEAVGFDISTQFPNSGIEGNKCRNPVGDELGFDRAFCFDKGGNSVDDYSYCDVTMCDPQTCIPLCGTPYEQTTGCPSFLQADECCENDDDGCKCRYLKEACLKSLDDNNTDFCYDALACYEDSGDSNGWCVQYDQMLTEFPLGVVANAVAESCCNFRDVWYANDQCLCDLYTYTEKDADVGGVQKRQVCNDVSYGKTDEELVEFYDATGGGHWYNNTGWSDDEPHCERFGIVCNNFDDIIEINLRNNNLTGVGAISWLRFRELKKLDLAENRLSGNIYPGSTLFLRSLVHIDVSNNEFSGQADMSFSSATLHANFSHNKFSSVSFKSFNAAYETMQVVDLSNNAIDQDASDVLRNLPSNIERLNLNNNLIGGAFPSPFPSLENMRHFTMANNNINGPLPDFSRNTPRVRTLDLSNQMQTGSGGLTGEISADFSNLNDLLVLNLASNRLTGIHSDVGGLDKLNVLNISSNALKQSIPSELAKLTDTLDILDLSANDLKRKIPSQFANFIERNTSVHLGENAEIEDPAPLMLCFLPNFDRANDKTMCPPERSALKDFFESAKGQDWTNNTGWLNPYLSVCSWFGVRCDDDNVHVINITLVNNGLAGTLSKEIGGLNFLKVLDLTDNDIMGVIPKEIGRLYNLTSLRLPYNRFVGEMPTELENLTNLELAQFHGNRISGTMPMLHWNVGNSSSYVTDCGNPSDFDESLGCEECTMCCNAQGDCHVQTETLIERMGFRNYTVFAVFLFGLLLALSCALALAIYAYDKYQSRDAVRSEPVHSPETPESIEADNKYALDSVGKNSAYGLILGKSWLGWTIALVTILAQIWMLFIFVNGAEIDLADDKSDLIYTWKCARDKVDCDYKSDLNWQGWVLFVILMAAHLLEDIINGFKLIAFSAKERHSRHDQTKCFVGGTLLIFISVFTLFVSTIYNYAIATTNTEIIINSVVILFITDLDELILQNLMVFNSRWVRRMSIQTADPQEELANENSKLKVELGAAKGTIVGLANDAVDLRARLHEIEVMLGIKEPSALSTSQS